MHYKFYWIVIIQWKKIHYDIVFTFSTEYDCLRWEKWKSACYIILHVYINNGEIKSVTYCNNFYNFLTNKKIPLFDKHYEANCNVIRNFYPFIIIEFSVLLYYTGTNLAIECLFIFFLFISSIEYFIFRVCNVETMICCWNNNFWFILLLPFLLLFCILNVINEWFIF